MFIRCSGDEPLSAVASQSTVVITTLVMWPILLPVVLDVHLATVVPLPTRRIHDRSWRTEAIRCWVRCFPVGITGHGWTRHPPSTHHAHVPTQSSTCYLFSLHQTISCTAVVLQRGYRLGAILPGTVVDSSLSNAWIRSSWSSNAVFDNPGW
jgi:hypothetical protein